MLTATDKRVLNAFRDGMERAGIEVVEFVAFGSRVRGDATPESDLDVMVAVWELASGDRRTISHCAWQAGIEFNLVVAPLVFTRAQLEHSPERGSTLLRVVREEGEPV